MVKRRNVLISSKGSVVITQLSSYPRTRAAITLLNRLLDPWRMSGLLSGSLSDQVQVEFRTGANMLRAYVPSRELWITVKDVLVFEEYEILDQFRLGNQPRDATVVDAGAFVGLYSLKAAPCVKSVVAIEPSVKNYGFLESNIRLNGIKNIQSFNVALWSSGGKQRFRDAGSTSSLNAGGDHQVKTLTLEEVVQNLTHVDLLKMDVEGAEYEILLSTSGSTLNRVDRIAAEVHLFDETFAARLKKLTGHLQKFGFNIVVFPTPLQSRYHAMTRPWRCSFHRCNGRYAFLYRLFLSSVYAAPPLMTHFMKDMEFGTLGLLFAYRI